jgi:hypothetical protein
MRFEMPMSPEFPGVAQILRFLDGLTSGTSSRATPGV